jgi:CBS domain-containing protein
MTARKLAQPFPLVTPDTDAMEAAQTMAAQRLPGLIVCDDDGRPYTVLPGSQVLRFLIPTYVQDDPGLARALDEEASDELCRKLVRSTVRDLLPQPPDLDELPVVDIDATALEVAAVMARMHSPLVATLVVVAVVDHHKGGNRVIGAITVSRLLDHLLPPVPASR